MREESLRAGDIAALSELGRLSPEQLLYLNMIVRAIWDVLYFDAQSDVATRSISWINSRSEETFSFMWCCEVARIKHPSIIRNFVANKGKDLKKEAKIHRVKSRVVKHFRGRYARSRRVGKVS